MHEWIHLFSNPATASVYGGDASLREKLSRTLSEFHEIKGLA
jgi:hypothetical protein